MMIGIIIVSVIAVLTMAVLLAGRKSGMESASENWQILRSESGWKLQKNIVTNHAMIVDPKGIRRAWGKENELSKTFDEIIVNL